MSWALAFVSGFSAHAQDPRLHIRLERPPALASVGSVLVAPNRQIVVNHDGSGGYQEGAIFVPYSSGHLVRVIEATPMLHWMLRPDGRFFVVYGPTGRRFPRPRLGRLFADGQLEVEAFQPPNPLASRWVPSMTAEGLTPGRWYALEAVIPRTPRAAALRGGRTANHFRCPQT